MKRPGRVQLLYDRGLRPKKSFGQNFLQEPKLCDTIAELATTPPGGSVLEIGAGLGALTSPLLKRAASVVAVERDRDLLPILSELFADEQALQLLEADAAQLDWLGHLAKGPRPHVVAGNLPYQISGRLIQRAVECAEQLDRVVFMVQKEVAERLVALPGNRTYGMLSVFTQAAFEIELALRVSAGAFRPAPRVASAVLVLTPHRPARARETETFRQVVSKAFGKRRKTLRNAWRDLLARDELTALAEAVDIDLDARAETLSVEDFGRLATAIDKR